MPLSSLYGKSFRNIFITGISGLLVSLSFADCHGKGLNEIRGSYDKALYEILDLNTISAQNLIDNDYGRYPDRPDMYLEYLANWKNVIEIVLSEDQSKYEKYLEQLDKRLHFIDKQADKKSPSYRILLAEIYAHAGMAQIFYRDYLSGFGKIIKANNYARENQEKYPGYWLNNKLCGVLNVSLDQMSPFLKKMMAIFNLEGNAETGFRQLSQYLKDVSDYPGLKAEALLYCGFALRIAKKDNDAYDLFKENIPSVKAPVLTLYLYSNIMCLTGRNEDARILLSTFADSKFEVPFSFKDYLYGKVILNRLDKNADVYLERFIHNSKSKNYKREICCRLSEYYFMNADAGKFKYYRQEINKFSRATTERDREADVELNRPYNPSPDLLKARYLVQGGYYQAASDILLKIKPAELTQKAYVNEYYLLMAKLKFNTGKLNEALVFSSMAMDKGRDCDEHYAAEAALLSGDIMARLGEKEKAADYYKLALKIKGQNDVYIENIEKIAKNRLKGI